MLRIRPWEPKDKAATMTVLRNASYSNVVPAYQAAVQRPSFQYITVAIVMTAYAVTHSLLVFFLFMGGVFGSLFLLQLAGTLFYLFGPPLHDMRDVQKTYFSDPDGHFWVAEMDSTNGKEPTEIIGTIAIVKKKSDDGKKVAWLRRMAVLRKCRRQGIAIKLVEKTVEFCRQRGYDRIDLITSEMHEAARSLYTKMGFKSTGYRPYKYIRKLVWIWTYEFVYNLNEDQDDLSEKQDNSTDHPHSM